MTPRQRELARHALGLPNKQRTSYRNYFVTGPGSADYDDWTAMVEAGEAIGRTSVLLGGDTLFVLTRLGTRAALDEGERMDEEDEVREASPTTSEGERADAEDAV